MDWKEYQEKTAKVFRDLGCTATVNKAIEGARAKHDIDVWVVFTKFGFETKWVIECKYWSTNVTKEKVLALKTIVDDVGADRGMIISKSGFQSGAIRATNNTNISLTSLEDLKETVREELLQSALSHLETKSIALKSELHELFSHEKTGPNSGLSKTLPGVDGRAVANSIGKLAILDFGFDKVKLGKPPYPVSFDDTDKKVIAQTVESFAEHASQVIEEIQKVLDSQTAKQTRDDS